MNLIIETGKRGLSPFLLLVACLLASGTVHATTDSYTTAGTINWTAPASVTSVTVQTWGGGGGGGAATGNPSKGGGGGGGGYDTQVVTVVPGNTYTVVIGAAGTGGNGAAGGAGGSSSFNGTVVAGGGGGGGLAAANGSAGMIGTGGTGIYAGGNGSSGIPAGGAGGGGAGSGGAGGNASGDTAGAGTAVGGGSGAAATTGGNCTNAATAAGGGGCGGYATGTADRKGGAGAAGRVDIAYVQPPTAVTSAASSVASYSATLNGAVNDNGADTTILFEYGLTVAYGSTATASPGLLAANTGSTAVSAALTGLACATTYHFRAVATNSSGVSYGGDLSFTTSACPTISFAFTSSACTDGVALGTVGQCALVTWSPQTAGLALGSIYITQLDAGVPTQLHPTQVRTRNMQFGLSCHDPVANAGMQATFSAASVALPLCQANGAIPTSWSAGDIVTFPGGSPSSSVAYTFNYDDVGKVELWMRYSVTTDQRGSSGAFVVVPHHFTISGVTAAPIKAGNDFVATVTAYNGLATPTVTANFGQETSPAGATLSFTKCHPTGINAVNGTFTGSVGLFAGGAASAANLNWSEVGNGDLVATLTGGNYLGSGLTVTGNTGTGGAPCNGAAAPGNVGRFIPDHFITTITDGCTGSGFSYSGQPFTLAVTAMNGLAVPTTTVNYDGTINTSPNFSKAVTLTAWDAATGLISPPEGSLTNTSVASADFTQGIATINATNVGPATLAPDFTFTSRITAPVQIRVRSDDTDAVTSSGFIEGTTWIRSGRASIANAHGLELHALPVQFRTEYWNNGWLFNTTDSCSGDDASGGTVSIGLAAPGGWAAGVACVQDDGVALGLSNSGCAAVGPVSQRFKQGGVVGFAGDFNLWLKAPGSGNTGTVIVTGNVPLWLQYPWTGAAAVNPEASATFGIYRGAKEFIDLRENY